MYVVRHDLYKLNIYLRPLCVYVQTLITYHFSYNTMFNERR